MKKTLFALVFTLISASFAAGQMMMPAEQEVLKINQSYDNAIIKQDIKTLAQIFADDYYFIDDDGKVMNKMQSLDEIKEADVKFDLGKSEDVKVRVLGDTAVLTGLWNTKGSYKNKPFQGTYRYTMVYARRGGRWQAISEQNTKVLSEPDRAAMEKALMDKENMGWNLIKAKRFDECEKAFGDEYRGVYSEGIMNKGNELAGFRTLNLENYALSDMKVTFPTKDTGIVTYKAAAKGVFMNKPFDEMYNVSSIWAMRGGEWQIVLHTESKAAK